MPKLRIVSAELQRTDVRTRIPARYGIAVVTECPCAFVRVVVEFEGRAHTGIASDLLPPRWFTKDPGETPADELAAMLRVIDHALQLARGLTADDPFDAWWTLYHAQHEWGRAVGLAPLLVNFGVTFVERALLEAACKSWESPLHRAVTLGRLRIPADVVHPELRGLALRELLPARPLTAVTVRQTVGIDMPLVDDDMPADERLNDGLPESLAAAVDRYGLRQFKIKLSGELARDRVGLERLADLFAVRIGGDYAVSLDGNEYFRSLAEFQDYWRQLRATPALEPILARLLFVEQPLAREIALETPLGEGTAPHERSDRPPLIIDESDSELSSLRRALALGYDGTSHKNCKGVFKSFLNAGYLAYLRRTNPNKRYLLSGEDMGNIGPVALLQDLAVVAALGIESVERNGHHYFAGLSMFPPAIQRQVAAAHPDLYTVAEPGFPTLNIAAGRLNLATVNAAPLGAGFELDLSSLA